MLIGLIPIANHHPGILIDTRVAVSVLLTEYARYTLSDHITDWNGYTIGDSACLGRAFTVPNWYKYLTIHYDPTYGYTTNLIVLTDPLDGSTSLGDAYLLVHRQQYNLLTTFHLESISAMMDTSKIQMDWHSYPLTFPCSMEVVERDLVWSYNTVSIERDVDDDYLNFVEYRDADASSLIATVIGQGPDVAWEALTDTLAAGAEGNLEKLQQRVPDEITRLFVKGMPRARSAQKDRYCQIVGADIEAIPRMNNGMIINYIQMINQQVSMRLKQDTLIASEEIIFADRLLVYLSRYLPSCFANSVFSYTVMTDTLRAYSEDSICYNRQATGNVMTFAADKEEFLTLFRRNLREMGCLNVEMLLTCTHECLITLSFTHRSNLLVHVDLTWLYLGTLSIFEESLIS